MPLLTFDQAIADSAEFSRRHLLLGNGFSIACKPNIFHYASLFAQADFSQAPQLKQAFEALGTQDFEVVLKALETGEKLLPIYGLGGSPTVIKLAEDAAILKEILVHTIASNHPRVPAEIGDNQFKPNSFLTSGIFRLWIKA